ASTQLGGALPRTQDLHVSDQAAAEHRAPAELGRELANVEPGLLGHFAPDAAGHIDLAVDDVVQVRRAAGEIDLTSIEGVGRHHAEQEGAVAGLDASHGKAVPHGPVGEIPMLPREEARVIDFETGPAEDTIGDRKLAQHQDAAVPEIRILAHELGPMGVDLASPLIGEGPAPLRIKGDVETL